MKKHSKILAAGICMLILVSVLGISAFAEKSVINDENKDEAPEAVVIPDEEIAEKAESPADLEETAEDDEKPETLFCAEGRKLYAEEGSVVFNNGGTVYNNGALVYNNGGTVYNNLGTCYNNGGIVYANGGSVYDNGGTVYNYDARLFTHGDEAGAVPAEEPEDNESKKSEADEEALPESADADKPDAEIEASDDEERFTVETDGDYSNAVDFDIPAEDGSLRLGTDETCRISAKPGYEISFAEVSSGTLSLEKDGSYMLRDLEADAVLKIEYRPLMPEFSLESGMYDEEQKLEITAADGMKIFYTLDGSEPDEKSEEYSKPLKLKEGCVVKAAALDEDGLSSEAAELSVNILELEIPEFKSVKEGYMEIAPQAIKIKNPGTLDAEIKNIVIKGEDPSAFVINRTAGQRIPAGESEEVFWKLYPQFGLKKGEYKASLCILFGEDGELSYNISFKVK